MTAGYILGDVVIESLFFVANCTVLVLLGSKPLRELIGHIRLMSFVAVSSCACASTYPAVVIRWVMYMVFRDVCDVSKFLIVGFPFFLTRCSDADL